LPPDDGEDEEVDELELDPSVGRRKLAKCSIALGDSSLRGDTGVCPVAAPDPVALL
jgi:hypothetical protein